MTNVGARKPEGAVHGRSAWMLRAGVVVVRRTTRVSASSSSMARVVSETAIRPRCLGARLSLRWPIRFKKLAEAGAGVGGEVVASVNARGERSLSQVARFIHLNGPPGIGKSTVASAFADRHPGVLNLDIDQVAALIGGYRDRFSDSFEAGRLLAAAMARVHLANGHDVIMPQMMTNVNAGELADFESAAAAASADYCQILLIARVGASVDRCMERAKGSDPHHDVISKVIERNGGRDFLRKLHAQVAEFTAGRGPHTVIDCERLTIEQTCQAVEDALRIPPGARISA
jgi:predicted ABC-type ATPase